jgi:hypothetical protein
MGFDPITVGFVVGGLSAGLSAAQAVSNNKAANRSGRIANENAKIQSKALRDQAESERLTREQEAAQIAGRLRVLAADSGGGAFSDLMRQNEIDTTINQQTIDQNLVNSTRSVNSNLQASIASLRMQSPFFSAAQGGLSGFATGLQLSSGINAATSNPNVGPPPSAYQNHYWYQAQKAAGGMW